ncbi:MAG TPA: zinc ribbon domain-containing protein [Candidatus Mediterraneibacter quadrami]|uniref:Zinc ribbon domain-containing protein n=1 Tax=Candidatus Mediterraneibacter quadrami TaxID=2838684 RepID=A0A9D2U858_9FIRM|nr:zinc ribbon domain-containing protein [Candidatus Mediterraneibacter quadrami]
MKDFWEDLGKRIGETAENMTAMAGDAIEIQRLKSQVRNLARGNAVDLMELGRTIYDRYKAGEEVDENAKALCEAIRDREASMGEYEKKIAQIKGASECPKCGKMVAKDMTYCPYCGEKVEKPDKETADADEYTDEAAGEAAEEPAADTEEKAE